MQSCRGGRAEYQGSTKSMLQTVVSPITPTLRKEQLSLSNIASTHLPAWFSRRKGKKKLKSVATASFVTLQLLVASLQLMQTTAVILCFGLQQSLLLCCWYSYLHSSEWCFLCECNSCTNGEAKKREGKAPKSTLLF